MPNLSRLLQRDLSFESENCCFVSFFICLLARGAARCAVTKQEISDTLNEPVLLAVLLHCRQTPAINSNGSKGNNLFLVDSSLRVFVKPS